MSARKNFKPMYRRERNSDNTPGMKPASTHRLPSCVRSSIPNNAQSIEYYLYWYVGEREVRCNIRIKVAVGTHYR